MARTFSARALPMNLPPLSDLLTHYLLGVSSLLAITNPFSTIPLLLTLTSGMTERQRRQQATRAARNATIIMLIALFIGGLILEFFSISIAALRIAGGLIVAFLGFRMLFPQPAVKSDGVGESVAERRHDYSLIPLALPSMAGAGSLALVMSYSTTIAELDHPTLKLIGYALAVAGIGTVGLIAALVLRAGSRIANRLGSNGLDALARVMGLLMVCIGVQFIGNGIIEFFHIQR